MIKINELKGIIVTKGYNQSQVAKIIGITPKTFYEKMKSGVFTSTEIERMIDILEIEDATSIFFAKE